MEELGCTRVLRLEIPPKRNAMSGRRCLLLLCHALLPCGHCRLPRPPLHPHAPPGPQMMPADAALDRGLVGCWRARATPQTVGQPKGMCGPSSQDACGTGPLHPHPPTHKAKHSRSPIPTRNRTHRQPPQTTQTMIVYKDVISGDEVVSRQTSLIPIPPSNPPTHPPTPPTHPPPSRSPTPSRSTP